MKRESQNNWRESWNDMASIFQMPPTFLFLIAFFYRGFPHSIDFLLFRTIDKEALLEIQIKSQSFFCYSSNSISSNFKVRFP